MREDRGRVLVVAGSDSGGGAGLQADIKTLAAFGAYAATAVTAITVQDTRGVHAVIPVDPQIVRAQGLAVLDDIGADALKLGMLGGAATMRVAAELIDRAGDAPAVIDPVMVAKGGHALMETGALDVLKAELLPRAALLTPNAPEAALLTGRRVETPDDLRRAAETLLQAGAQAVLVKGGHLAGPIVVDVLVSRDGETRFESDRIASRHTHGTGCTLASAIAAGLSQGVALEAAVVAARAYVLGAITHAPGFGAGHGPLEHAWRLRPPRF